MRHGVFGTSVMNARPGGVVSVRRVKDDIVSIIDVPGMFPPDALGRVVVVT